MATRKKLLNNSDHLTVGGADLYRGDALAVLPTLAGPFGAVITDPPYSSGGQSKGDRARSTGQKYLNSGATKYPDFLGDTKDQRSYLHWSALWMALCHARMADGGLIVVFSDWRQLPVTTDALQAAGFIWRGIAVWDKTAGARPYKGGFRSQCEYIVWGSKGSLTGERYNPGLFRAPPTAGGKFHQVGKPEALMADLVAAGIAALKQGKRFTGIEISGHYFDAAVERMCSSMASPGAKPKTGANLERIRHALQKWPRGKEWRQDCETRRRQGGCLRRATQRDARQRLLQRQHRSGPASERLRLHVRLPAHRRRGGSPGREGPGQAAGREVTRRTGAEIQGRPGALKSSRNN